MGQYPYKVYLIHKKVKNPHDHTQIGLTIHQQIAPMRDTYEMMYHRL